jgi:hypothetical protein
MQAGREYNERQRMGQTRDGSPENGASRVEACAEMTRKTFGTQGGMVENQPRGDSAGAWLPDELLESLSSTSDEPRIKARWSIRIE